MIFSKKARRVYLGLYSANLVLRGDRNDLKLIMGVKHPWLDFLTTMIVKTRIKQTIHYLLIFFLKNHLTCVKRKKNNEAHAGL